MKIFIYINVNNKIKQLKNKSIMLVLAKKSDYILYNSFLLLI